ncbi:hypothetical protein EPUL_006115, partial [Erysiphe pulchra]
MDEIMSQLKNITSALGELKTSENKGKGKETVEAIAAPGQSLFVPPKAPTFFKPLPDNFKFAEASNSSTSFKVPKTDRLDFSSLKKNHSARETKISCYPLTQREEKVKKCFPDFFPRSEAENPDGPLREATKRNRVVFSNELKLKYANSYTLEKLYQMQVAMIQSMLPYTAWPVRVALEMEEDFLAARRAINNHSLDWAGAVDCILTVLFKHNVLGASLTNLARLM